MSRDSKVRKRERKARNKAHVEELLTQEGESRKRWQGKVDLKFGKHPDAVWRVEFSGVKVPVDLGDPDHLDGVKELTDLALSDVKNEDVS